MHRRKLLVMSSHFRKITVNTHAHNIHTHTQNIQTQHTNTTHAHTHTHTHTHTYTHTRTHTYTHRETLIDTSHIDTEKPYKPTHKTFYKKNQPKKLLNFVFGNRSKLQVRH